MELIHKIKQAESDAKKVVENAQRQAADISIQTKDTIAALWEQARRQRTDAINSAVSAARKQAEEQISQMQQQAGQSRVAMIQQAKSKMNAAVQKVLEYVKNLAN